MLWMIRRRLRSSFRNGQKMTNFRLEIRGQWSLKIALRCFEMMMVQRLMNLDKSWTAESSLTKTIVLR